ncbi:MAG: DUF2281 domain-containing protein [Hyphomicrobiaceae bacterium]
MSIAETVYEKLKSAPPEVAKQVLDFLELLEAKAKQASPKPASSWDDYMGVLRDSKLFAGDPVETQRRLRAEWDRE